jgi:hypothetical protein
MAFVVVVYNRELASKRLIAHCRRARGNNASLDASRIRTALLVATTPQSMKCVKVVRHQARRMLHAVSIGDIGERGD